MRYYLVGNDGEVLLESVFESYAARGQLAEPGTIATPSRAALDAWRRQSGSHFFQVSMFNHSGEPYVVAELSWPLLSFWREQIDEGTMTLQKLHARHPDYEAQWFDEDDSAADRERALSKEAVRRDRRRNRPMFDLTFEEFIVRVPELFAEIKENPEEVAPSGP